MFSISDCCQFHWPDTRSTTNKLLYWGQKQLNTGLGSLKLPDWSCCCGRCSIELDAVQCFVKCTVFSTRILYTHGTPSQSRPPITQQPIRGQYTPHLTNYSTVFSSPDHQTTEEGGLCQVTSPYKGMLFPACSAEINIINSSVLFQQCAFSAIDVLFWYFKALEKQIYRSSRTFEHL